MPLGRGECAARCSSMCEANSRLSTCWQRRGFVHQMNRGAAFCQFFRLLLSGKLPTVLSSTSSASSTHYLHLQSIYKVPSARREWQRVIRKQLKRQVLRGFHLIVYCSVSVCAYVLMSQQWSEWTAVTLQIIKNELKFRLSDAARTSTQKLKRLCPRNSLNHKHIGLTGHQLLLPYPNLNHPSTPSNSSLLSPLHTFTRLSRKKKGKKSSAVSCNHQLSMLILVQNIDFSKRIKLPLLPLDSWLMFWCNIHWIFALLT